MKNLTLYYCIALVVGCSFGTLQAQYTLTTNPYAVNGWMNKSIGDGSNIYNCQGDGLTFSVTPSVCNLNGRVDDSLLTPLCSLKVKNLFASLIRYGGHSNDVNMPTHGQLLTEIDRIRSLGAEPIIQVPMYNFTAYSTTDASNMLTFLNVTSGRKIKYIELGNEYDKYPNYPTLHRADTIAKYFKAFAQALKAVDSTILIIGPSLSAYDGTVYTSLLTSTSAASIVGKDANNHYYLDIVDVHRYKFDGTQKWRSTIISDPANFASGVLTNGSTLLLDLIHTANGTRSAQHPLQFSMSELNIGWKNPTSNTWKGLGANSFLAGQYLADIYSTVLDKAATTSVTVAFLAPWSFYESGGNAGQFDLGILDGASICNSDERSTYEHMAMMGQYMNSGVFYKGTNNLSNNNVKQFGTKMSNGYYAIMLLNQDSVTTYPYTINTGTSTAGSTSLVVTMNMGGSSTYSYSPGIPPQSTHLIFLDCNGAFSKSYKYDTTLAKTHSAPALLTGTGNVPVSLTLSSSTTGCTTLTSTGSATVSASGGTGSYTYTWSPSGGNGATASNLAAGSYTVSVTSGTACPATYKASVNITAGSPTISINPTSANSCSGSAATFTATGGGGTSPYTYSWSSGATTSTVSIPAPSTNTVTEYTVTVTDAHGCTNTAQATNYGTRSVSISGTTQTAHCCGVNLTSSPYIPGAKYVWTVSSGTLVSTVSNTYVYNNLWGDPGNYTLTITPSSGDPCSAMTLTYNVASVGPDCNCGNSPSPRVAFNSTSGTPSNSQTLIPNPTSNQVNVQYSVIENTDHAEINLINIYGQSVGRYRLNVKENNLPIDCSALAPGIYSSIFIVDDKVVSTQKLIVIR